MAKHVQERRDRGQERYEAKIYNERVKMVASAFNALGIALVGSAFVFPVIRDANPAALLELRTWAWIAGGIGLSLVGVVTIGAMKRED